MEQLVWKRRAGFTADIDRLFRAKQNLRINNQSTHNAGLFTSFWKWDNLTIPISFAKQTVLIAIHKMDLYEKSWNECNLSELQNNLLIATPLKEYNNRAGITPLYM